MTGLRCEADDDFTIWEGCGCRPVVPNTPVFPEPTSLAEDQLDKLVAEGRVVRLSDYAVSMLGILTMLDQDQAANCLIESAYAKQMPEELVAVYSTKKAARDAADAAQLVMEIRRLGERARFDELIGAEQMRREALGRGEDEQFVAACLNELYIRFTSAYAGGKRRAEARTTLQNVLRSYLFTSDLPE